MTAIPGPAEALRAEVEHNGRRYHLCLVSAHYARTGVAIFTETTLENAKDGEPEHDIFQDVGSWTIEPSRDVDGEAVPSVLKVDCRLPEDCPASVLNELIAHVALWADGWEECS